MIRDLKTFIDAGYLESESTIVSGKTIGQIPRGKRAIRIEAPLPRASQRGPLNEEKWVSMV